MKIRGGRGIVGLWDWIKYIVRTRALNYSRGKGRQRKEKEKSLLQEYGEATRLYENYANDTMGARLKEIKDKLLELFMKRKQMGL